MATSHFTVPALGQPIPESTDFPVQWALPTQAHQLWVLDRMHFGELMLPLAADVARCRVGPGFNRAAARYQLPVRIEFLYVNGYLYNCNQPVGLPPEFVQKGLNALSRLAPGIFNLVQGQATARMTATYMMHVEPIIAMLDTQWKNNWLPELQQHIAFWQEFNLTNASLSDLLIHLDESLKRIERLWDLHFEILVPAIVALSRFIDEYRDLLETEGGFAGDSSSVFRLAQGESNSFLLADQALWQLSRQARTMPVVRQILEQHPAADVIPLLANSPEGQIFLAEVRVWLDNYGRRGYKSDGLSEVSWIEDPTPVIQNLQETITWPDRDIQAEVQAQVATREQLIAQARQRVQCQPAIPAASALAQFESMLKAAQIGEFLLNEHNFWIDQQGMQRLRAVFAEIGRRCVQAGVLDQPLDIFYLTLDDLFATAQSTTGQSTTVLPRQALVAQRKAQLLHFHSLTPPDAIGTMPLMVPPDEPFVRAMTRFFGAPLVPVNTPPRTPSPVVRGHAASPGKLRGTARVIRSLEEAERLQAGDILVTMATMPPWTPLLAIAGAVVTDVGGILSHAAIIAREYGIPAVVGTRVATQVIQDGQLLEVDGSNGVVHILPESNSISSTANYPPQRV